MLFNSTVIFSLLILFFSNIALADNSVCDELGSEKDMYIAAHLAEKAYTKEVFSYCGLASSKNRDLWRYFLIEEDDFKIVDIESVDSMLVSYEKALNNVPKDLGGAEAYLKHAYNKLLNWSIQFHLRSDSNCSDKALKNIEILIRDLDKDYSDQKHIVVQAYNYKAVCFSMNKEFTKSISIYMSILENYKNNLYASVVFIQIAKIYSIKNEYEKTLLYINKAINACKKTESVDCFSLLEKNINDKDFDNYIAYENFAKLKETVLSEFLKPMTGTIIPPKK